MVSRNSHNRIESIWVVSPKAGKFALRVSYVSGERDALLFNGRHSDEINVALALAGVINCFFFYEHHDANDAQLLPRYPRFAQLQIPSEFARNLQKIQSTVSFAFRQTGGLPLLSPRRDNCDCCDSR